MKSLTRIQTLEKQNKDLRVRIENMQVKHELAQYGKDNELKELMTQLKSKDKVIAMLQAGLESVTEENAKLRREKSELSAENEALRDALDEAEDRASKLAAMLKKDSTTSGKPPSMDNEFTKAKATSEKKKSEKKRGGQPGHVGHRLEPVQNPDVVIDMKPPTLCPCCRGNVVESGEFESRQIFDVKVAVTVTEERSHSGRCIDCGSTYRGEFSEDFKSPVGYGSEVKTMVATLNADANVPINKTAKFISSLTDGLINMSDGTVVNIVSELARKLSPTVQDIVLMLASCGVLNVDETGIRINGSLNWMQIISNDNYSLFGRSLKRGTLNEMMNNLILLFTGVLVHDHLTSYYRYSHLTHAECNVHILRYLKAVTEIMKHPWAQNMAKLLTDANNRKKDLIESGTFSMDPKELKNIRCEFMSVLEQGRLQYDAAITGKKNITYYDEERRLLNRLAKFIDEHLLFITDFHVPFSNNGAEHGARHIKSKKKTSGGFRSDSGADNYATIASVIATLRKQGLNIFSSIKASFQGECPRFLVDTFQDTS